MPGKRDVRARRVDGICYQLVRDGRIEALAMKLTNGLWTVTDVDDRRLMPGSFRSPNDCARALQEKHVRQSKITDVKLADVAT